MQRKAVTLTELLVAIIIIAILSVVVATNMSTATEGATRAQLLDMADKVSTALASALANRPDSGGGVPDASPPIAGWNPSGSPDPTHWEKYIGFGDFQRIYDSRAQFGFIAAPPGGWGGSWDSHPGPAASAFKPPRGTVMPEKLYLIDDPFFQAFSNTSTHHKYVGQIPYHAP